MCQNLEDNTDLRAALDQHESGEHGMQIFFKRHIEINEKVFSFSGKAWVFLKVIKPSPGPRKGKNKQDFFSWTEKEKEGSKNQEGNHHLCLKPLAKIIAKKRKKKKNRRLGKNPRTREQKGQRQGRRPKGGRVNEEKSPVCTPISPLMAKWLIQSNSSPNPPASTYLGNCLPFISKWLGKKRNTRAHARPSISMAFFLSWCAVQD